MPETIEEMQKRHTKEIEALLAGCPHEKISGQRIFIWGPGQVGGSVKVCMRCGKVVESASAIASSAPWRS